MNPLKLMHSKYVAQGAARHMRGEVPRFDQRNQMFMRATWHPAWREAFPVLDRLFLRFDDMLGYRRAARAGAFWEQ